MSHVRRPAAKPPHTRFLATLRARSLRTALHSSTVQIPHQVEGAKMDSQSRALLICRLSGLPESYVRTQGGTQCRITVLDPLTPQRSFHFLTASIFYLRLACGCRLLLVVLAQRASSDKTAVAHPRCPTLMSLLTFRRDSVALQGRLCRLRCWSCWVTRIRTQANLDPKSGMTLQVQMHRARTAWHEGKVSSKPAVEQQRRWGLHSAGT
mmetsp:Transcript_4985/g.12130  ORF Transcript_4985/g.12130 Transcript_4985/m.12130 type:complete len:209 (-) Transcript_4985:416-1042(-)